MLAAAQPQASNALAAMYATGRDPSLGDKMKDAVGVLLLSVHPGGMRPSKIGSAVSNAFLSSCLLCYNLVQHFRHADVALDTANHGQIACSLHSKIYCTCLPCRGTGKQSHAAPEQRVV